MLSGSLVVSGQQKFLESPQSLISAPGKQVTLTCLVQNKGGECRWQKDGKVMIEWSIVMMITMIMISSLSECILASTRCPSPLETAV